MIFILNASFPIFSITLSNLKAKIVYIRLSVQYLKI